MVLWVNSGYGVGVEKCKKGDGCEEGESEHLGVTRGKSSLGHVVEKRSGMNDTRQNG